MIGKSNSFNRWQSKKKFLRCANFFKKIYNLSKMKVKEILYHQVDTISLLQSAIKMLVFERFCGYLMTSLDVETLPSA